MQDSIFDAILLILGRSFFYPRFDHDLQKKSKRNEGEVPQYYVRNSHEAIIPPDVWDRVQEEMQRRKAMGKAHSCRSPFSSMIVCGDCSGFYGPKVWNFTDRYRRTIWQCNNKFKCGCTTPIWGRTIYANG